ncbi:Crp/Fnr family transcriptional regulator [Paenibacillus sp. MBLB4367]|uniref:Crp/Fnr family transcriptional regulator n=1 Tax=Paenibacillus sp. MBLB4367 TaxID=3384767 RepID=UPI003907E976
MSFDALRKVPLFNPWNDSQLEAVAGLCTRKSFKAGTVLFRENEPGNTFYIVLKGSIKLYTSRGGDEKILSVIHEGDCFGELSLLDGKARSASAQTLSDSTLLSLTASQFLSLLKSDFYMTLMIMRELCQRLRDTNQHVNDLTFLDARSRVIKSVITLANKHGNRQGNTITIKLVLNYDELSQMSSVQKPVLMQVMRDLHDKQILVHEGSDIKLDLSKLR